MSDMEEAGCGCLLWSIVIIVAFCIHPVAGIIVVAIMLAAG